MSQHEERLSYLKHFDAHENIECLLKFGRELTVIHEVDSYTVLETHFLDSFLRQLLLLHGKGDSIHLTAKGSCSLERK